MKKVISILLAMYFMLSSIGLNASAHYCMGNIANLGLGFATEVDGCGMEDTRSDCEPSSTSHVEPYDCCADKYQHLLVENDFAGSGHFDFEKPILLTGLFNSFFTVQNIPVSRIDFIIPPNNPPPRFISYRILFCTFLI